MQNPWPHAIPGATSFGCALWSEPSMTAPSHKLCHGACLKVATEHVWNKVPNLETKGGCLVGKSGREAWPHVVTTTAMYTLPIQYLKLEVDSVSRGSFPGQNLLHMWFIAVSGGWISKPRNNTAAIDNTEKGPNMPQPCAKMCKAIQRIKRYQVIPRYRVGFWDSSNYGSDM